MKIYLTILFVFFTIFSSVGQLRNSFDIIVGVDRSFRNITLDEDAALFDFVAPDSIIAYHHFEPVDRALKRAEQNRPKLNRRLGVNYRKVLSNNTYLKGGLILSSVGYQLSEESDLRSQNGDPNSPDEIKKFIDYMFIEIPLVFGLTTRKDKFSFFVETGFSPNIYAALNLREKTDIGNISRVDYYDFPKGIMLSIVGAVGIEYHLNEDISFFGQPSYRYFITSANSYRGEYDNGVRRHLFSYGIEFGFRTNLGVANN